MKLLSCLAVASLAGCAEAPEESVATAASTIATPWLVVQCSYPDLLAVPYLGLDWMLWGLFNDSSDPNSLWSYFQRQSAGQVDTRGTLVTRAYAFPAYDDYDTEVRKSRAEVTGDCLDLALDDVYASGHSPYDFYGVMAVIHGPSNDGAWGGGGPQLLHTPHHVPEWIVMPAILVGASHVTDEAPAGDMSFMAHELLHGYGTPHAYDLKTATEYGDPWDVMSVYGAYMTPEDTDHCIFVSPMDDNGDASGRKCPTGPNLSAAYRDQRGWLPPDRVIDWFAQYPVEEKLAPIDEAGTQWRNAIRIPANDGVPGSRWYVEFRWPHAFDAGLPHPAVLIHYYDGARQSLMNNLTADGGLGVGATFVDPLRHFRVRVMAIDAATQTATVRLFPM